MPVLSVAASEQRVVVTKDDDFVQSHLIAGRPEKLLLIATGNIGNTELETLLRGNLARIVEINRYKLTAHD